MNPEEFYKQLESTSSDLFDVALGHESSEDRYTEMEDIGCGSSKTIRKALDLSSGRSIALALPNENLTKEQVRSFLEEARLNASLQHPNIIQVYNLGYRQDGTPFFTMKLCTHKKLSHLLADSANNLFTLIEIFLKICEAMDYAHSKGAIHRDLKDDNILLGDFGEVFVSDWGSAQILSNSLLEQELGQFTSPISKGTSGFMSPEQHAGDEISISQDIYSLGALLYKILTQKNPTQDAPAPREINHQTPLGLEAICLKAMAHNHQHRYHNCAELINDVRAYLSGFAPKAEAASINKQITLFLIRHKALSFTSLLCLILISVLSIFYVYSLKNKEKQTASERDRAENALELYDIEKSSRMKIASMGADYFIRQANQLISSHTSTLALELLDSIPHNKLNKKQLKSIYTSYGRIYFYRQEFNKAITYLQKGEVYKDNKLLEIAQHFVDIKNSDQNKLDTVETIKIINSLFTIDLHQVHCFFREQVLQIKDYEGQIPIIQKMIMLNNSIDSVDIKFEIIDEKHHLDLSHNKLMRRWEPTREMKLTSLDLSYSPVRTHFYVLYNMPLETLNIAHCKISKFDFLNELKYLKTLTIDSKTAQKQSLIDLQKELGFTLKVID
ncbi:serine/threonine-protein kinase [Lentisphaera profundi]|uniref:Serine/threonine-protein kinase n=1 Tax=Lentisphaera profundi TaxID=1658616 RepID=A0ABY7VWB2_9BACT|nr:serine/threonine-protein kinase [Lentisphaera profundi]WDE97480.1 serine/threonine-protein kinase [Lentisphaera profundi]